MKNIVTLLFIFGSIFVSAQQAPIAIVSTNGTTKLTSTLDSAAYLAQTDDIIYLPGGTFNLPNPYLILDKKVSIIGVGHNPDSTSATGRTMIVGNLGFYTNAQGSILDGVYVSGDIYVTGVGTKIFRTNTNSIAPYPGWAQGVNSILMHCVIRNRLYNMDVYGNLYGLSNSQIKNCIIGSGINSTNFTAGQFNNNFENCIFINEETNYPLSQSSQCTFKNCTFTKIFSWNSTPGNNILIGNVFATGSVPPTDSSQTIPVGNYLNQTDAGTFSAGTGTGYDYANDYFINGSSPCQSCGIYGGSTPWVKGNIPPNPHIRTKNVDATTGSGGLLRVRFNVSTQ